MLPPKTSLVTYLLSVRIPERQLFLLHAGKLDLVVVESAGRAVREKGEEKGWWWMGDGESSWSRSLSLALVWIIRRPGPPGGNAARHNSKAGKPTLQYVAPEGRLRLYYVNELPISHNGRLLTMKTIKPGNKALHSRPLLVSGQSIYSLHHATSTIFTQSTMQPTQVNLLSSSPAVPWLLMAPGPESDSLTCTKSLRPPSHASSGSGRD